MTFTDIEEYNMRSITNLDCNTNSEFTVAQVTLPNAAPRTVKIFAVYDSILQFAKLMKYFGHLGIKKQLHILNHTGI